jgi:hypothetical protein
MTTEALTIIGGIDTHKHTHYAAAVDQHGRLLGHQEFPATDRGYQRLLGWMRPTWSNPCDRCRKHRIVWCHLDQGIDKGR